MSLCSSINFYVPTRKLASLLRSLAKSCNKPGRPSGKECLLHIDDQTIAFPTSKSVRKKSVTVRRGDDRTEFDIEYPMRATPLLRSITTDSELRKLMADDQKTVWLRFSLSIARGDAYDCVTLTGATSTGNTLLVADAADLRKTFRSAWRSSKGVLATVSADDSTVLLDDAFALGDECEVQVIADGDKPAVDRFVEATLAERDGRVVQVAEDVALPTADYAPNWQDKIRENLPFPCRDDAIATYRFTLEYVAERCGVPLKLEVGQQLRAGDKSLPEPLRHEFDRLVTEEMERNYDLPGEGDPRRAAAVEIVAAGLRQEFPNWANESQLRSKLPAPPRLKLKKGCESDALFLQFVTCSIDEAWHTADRHVAEKRLLAAWLTLVQAVKECRRQMVFCSSRSSRDSDDRILERLETRLETIVAEAYRGPLWQHIENEEWWLAAETWARLKAWTPDAVTDEDSRGYERLYEFCETLRRKAQNRKTASEHTEREWSTYRAILDRASRFEATGSVSPITPSSECTWALDVSQAAMLHDMELPRMSAGVAERVHRVENALPPLAVSPTGEMFAVLSASKSHIIWVDLTDDNRQHVLEVPPGQGGVSDMHFGPDGQSLWVSTSSYGGRLRALTIDGAFEDFETDIRPSRFALSADGRWFAVSRDNAWQVGRISSGKFHAVMEMEECRILTYAFSPDSKYLAIMDDDHTTRLWSLPNLKHEATFPRQQSDVMGSLAFSPDGQFIALPQADDEVGIWKLPEARLVGLWQGLGESVNCLAWSSSGDQLFCTAGMNQFAVCQWPQGKTLQCIEAADPWADDHQAQTSGRKAKSQSRPHSSKAKQATVTPRYFQRLTPRSVGVSTEGDVIAVGLKDDKKAVYWGLRELRRTGDWLGAEPLSDDVRQFQFSQSGTAIAIASNDQIVEYWTLKPR